MVPGRPDGPVNPTATAYSGEADRFNRELLGIVTGVALLILLCYILARGHHWPFTSPSKHVINTAFLVAELVLVILYRESNWYEQLKLSDSLPAPIGTGVSIAAELEKLAELAEESAAEFRKARDKLR